MATYILTHLTVNGVEALIDAEVPVLMDEDKVVIAKYEANPVSVKIKNTCATDKTVKKVTVTQETFNIPAGGTVTIPYDPTKDVIEIS